MDYEKYLTNLGPLGLTFALVIALGYIVRIIPVIQNKFIPLFAVVAGAVLLPLIAPAGYVDEQWKNPTVVLAIYGFIVGVAAWAAHALIIARIEDFISSKVPAVGKLLNQTSDNPKPPNVPLWLLAGLLAAGLAFGAVGCKSPKLEAGGAYAPTNAVGLVVYQDVGLAVADATYKFTYEATLAVFRFEREHRAELWAISPKIKAELDQLRPKVVDVNRRWALARHAYKANPTPAGLSTLKTILSELQRLLPAAQSQLNQATDKLAQPNN